jgi:hypothetical protein
LTVTSEFAVWNPDFQASIADSWDEAPAPFRVPLSDAPPSEGVVEEVSSLEAPQAVMMRLSAKAADAVAAARRERVRFTLVPLWDRISRSKLV